MVFQVSSAAQLRFSGTGIRIIPHKNSVLPISRDIAILLGGPFANILVWAVLLPIGKAQSFAYMNLFLGFFNLLPYRSLDGGEAIISLSEYSGGCGRAMRAEKVLAFVNILLAAVIAAVAVKHEFMSFTLLVMLVWLTAEELLGQREK